jgi:hypothetical protein
MRILNPFAMSARRREQNAALMAEQEGESRQCLRCSFVIMANGKQRNGLDRPNTSNPH